MKKSKTILFCILDWGLGHSSRCVPIIKDLKRGGFEIVLASADRSAEYLKRVFPNLIHEELPAYNPQYSLKMTMVASMAKQLPHFAYIIQKENLYTEHLVYKHDASLVISDNRYGCYSTSVPSIFITHQTNIHLPKWMLGGPLMINYFNRKQIEKFSALWIPDVMGEENLSGDLSAHSHIEIPVTYIGWLSALQNVAINKKLTEYKILALVSGPEPKRTEFEERIRTFLHSVYGKHVMVKGKPESNEITQNGNITEYDFAEGKELKQLMMGAGQWICRSGYSTLMDAAICGKKIMLVPTPGQTEQEYLAKYLTEQGRAVWLPEDDTDLNWEYEMKKSIKPLSENEIKSTDFVKLVNEWL